MGPSKRKGSVRRQVLDLNAREDSPSRPTWQTKYQNVLPEEEFQQNGDSQTSKVSVQVNPLSGLLGNYNSDSDSEESTQKPNNSLDAKVEDFLKEIQSISTESSKEPQQEAEIKQSDVQVEISYPPSVTAWQQCYDHNSGFPYYWNTETNEVTWEMPADLKAAIAMVAMKHQKQQQQQQQQQAPQKLSLKEPEIKKKICKYPWQTESDSEDEKVEMITSFGPQSGEESDGEEQSKVLKDPCKIGPHLPLTSPASKIRSNCITLAPEDPDGLNENIYETSSLLTHGVQDTGPPGDESFHMHKQSIMQVSAAVENPKIQTLNIIAPVENDVEKLNEVAVVEKQESSSNSLSDCKVKKESIADDVIAQIEKETPPDYGEKLKPEKASSQTSPVNHTTSGIALIANYGDDSESEDNSFNEKRKSNCKTPAKRLFPIEIPEEEIKPVFPCMGAEIAKPSSEVSHKEAPPEETEIISNIYNSEIDDPAVQKAFKRKKRIEFATTIYGPTSKGLECKTGSSESSVSLPTTQYNLDPNANDHQGFGFNALKAQSSDSERKTYKDCGGIQFVKAETLNLSEPKPKIETELENSSAFKGVVEEPVKHDEIEDASSLLREKVTFLTGGADGISPIQQMAIELETLVLAWQQGALTPPYLMNWLKEKCSELIRHEKTAAPTGWTCLWDRKSKRYFYRNTATKAIQWDYPNVEEKSKAKDGDVEGAGDEMDICDTPPHLSPTLPNKEADETPNTPSPPVISDVSKEVSLPSPTPQPPPPPQISYCPESESVAKVIKRKKRKLEEVSTSTEDESAAAIQPPVTSEYEQNENVEAPPLPPMPPPPPPPPDESPPSLPDSPPPLPLDPDQPLPPGVDEPEYSLYRTSKHSYKKSQPDSAGYSAELLMTYGYGLPVQQVVSSNGQPMTMQMQALDYHTYMHESVTNPYLVQSAPTSHVIHCPAKKPKPSLTSELVSFYSDLAMLDKAGESIQSNAQNKSSAALAPQEPAPSPAPAPAPPPPPVTQAIPQTTSKSLADTSSTHVKAAESVTSNGLMTKKKKKTRTASGLSLKKKGVSSLVAKWQQVQQEVRRDFSDDDEDSPPSK